MGDSKSRPKGDSTDDIFDALNDRRRRRVLRHMLASGGRTTLDRVGAEIAAAEDLDFGSEDEEAAITSLHHVHLPKLAGCGLISYDSQHLVVTTATDIDDSLGEVERELRQIRA